MRKKKIQWSTILLIVILVIGLSLLLYPTFSDWWNSMHQTRVIASYTEQVAGMDYCPWSPALLTVSTATGCWSAGTVSIPYLKKPTSSALPLTPYKLNPWL